MNGPGTVTITLPTSAAGAVRGVIRREIKRRVREVERDPRSEHLPLITTKLRHLNDAAEAIDAAFAERWREVTGDARTADPAANGTAGAESAPPDA